ncbi:MAG: hypothetical protein AB1345_13390 [Chloroflexota bacterium]
MLLIFLSACVPAAPVVDVSLTDSQPEPLPSSTPTIVWFPPTPTQTHMPTATVLPTLDMRSGLGAVLFTDTFTDSIHWSVGTFPDGKISAGKQAIILAVDQPRGYLFSLRSEPTFSDFYLEITATVSLCLAGDQYGVLFRARDGTTFYRIVFTCDGHARLDQVKDSQTAVLQPFTSVSIFPPGAPSELRLGIWAAGNDLRFFVDDNFIFQVADRVLAEGLIGVFARSAGETAVTVSFSDLVVWEINR